MIPKNKKTQIIELKKERDDAYKSIEALTKTKVSMTEMINLRSKQYQSSRDELANQGVMRDQDQGYIKLQGDKIEELELELKKERG